MIDYHGASAHLDDCSSQASRATFPRNPGLTSATMMAFACCLVAALLLGGCAAGGDITKPIPSAYYPAPQKADRTVVMLPGIADDLEALQDRRVAELIQDAWPHADVVLTGLTLPFYKQGQAARRLHDEVIRRYRKAGQPLWLAGISLGGMGVLLYDREYSGDAAGMLLMSPYLGEDGIREQIRAAGGLAQWDPGPPQAIDASNFQHELWRYIKSWQATPSRTESAWMAYGADEKFREPDGMIAPLFPKGHVIVLPGRHNWDLWNRAFPKLLQRAGD